MKKQLYSLHGIIFQAGMVFGTATKPGVGLAVTLEKAMMYSMFHSVVGLEDEHEDEYSGTMTDKWGYSAITHFKMTDSEISFQKQYDRRPPITYSFMKKEGDVWHGTYSGRDCGEGTSKLTVVPIDESFFYPPNLG